jgi:hypothetical protein
MGARTGSRTRTAGFGIGRLDSRVIEMLRFATFAVLLPFVPLPMRACSVAPCPSIEVTSDFTVMLKSQGKPLEGVTVKVTDQAAVVSFSGVTASTGAVTVSGLTPGHYSIRADLLGISAAYQCLYVAEQASLNAKAANDL